MVRYNVHIVLQFYYYCGESRPEDQNLRNVFSKSELVRRSNEMSGTFHGFTKTNSPLPILLAIAVRIDSLTFYLRGLDFHFQSSSGAHSVNI